MRFALYESLIEGDEFARVAAGSEVQRIREVQTKLRPLQRFDHRLRVFYLDIRKGD